MLENSVKYYQTYIQQSKQAKKESEERIKELKTMKIDEDRMKL